MTTFLSHPSNTKIYKTIVRNVGQGSTTNTVTETSNNNNSISNPINTTPISTPITSTVATPSATTPVDLRTYEEKLAESRRLLDELYAQRDALRQNAITTVQEVATTPNTTAQSPATTPSVNTSTSSTNTQPSSSSSSSSSAVSNNALDPEELLKKNSEFQRNMGEVLHHMEQTPPLSNDVSHTIIKHQEEVQQTLTAIKASCDVVGHKTATILQSCNVQIEECEKADQRQKALMARLKEFLESSDGRKTLKRIALGFGLGYTIYYVCRYRTIPIRGFIQGVASFFGGGPSSSSSSHVPNATTSNVSTPNNNSITINMPSVQPSGQVSPPGILQTPHSFSDQILSFIDSVGPIGLTCIPVILWLLKRK